MLQIFLKMKGLRAREYKYTPSEHDESVSENLSTEGDANLVSFIVAPPSRSNNYNSVVAPRNITQIRNLQLRKEGK